MKALTLTQPWAALVAMGAKKIETRNWSTAYRGPLVIHAAKGLGPVGGKRGFCNLVWGQPFASVLFPGWRDADDDDTVRAFEFGAIVATCTLIDCVLTHNPAVAHEPGTPWFVGARKGVGQHYYEVPPPEDSNEYAFGDYSPGRFAWLLADVKALPEPVECRGALGLWEPDTLTQMAIKRQEIKVL